MAMTFIHIIFISRIYIKDSERLQFSEQALMMCMQCLQGHVKNVATMNHASVQKLLQDIFKAYKKVQKHMPNMENKFANMLSDVYKIYMKDKVSVCTRTVSSCAFD